MLLILGWYYLEKAGSAEPCLVLPGVTDATDPCLVLLGEGWFC
jgi:hypothetical protein